MRERQRALLEQPALIGAIISQHGISRQRFYGQPGPLGSRMPKTLFTHRHDQLRALLVDARKRAGLKQVDVAAALGRPQSFVSKYESGERRLDVVEFIDIAEAIGTEAADIVAEMQRSSPRRKRR